MPAPTPSKLDQQQVLQGSYDESSGRIRVDAELTSTIIPPPGLEVSINSIDDSVAIGNTNNSDTLEVNPDGSINVDATIVGGNVTLFTEPYDAITATYPTTTQEVYQSRVGGIGGTVQQTVTVNYTDMTKNFILNLART